MASREVDEFQETILQNIIRVSEGMPVSRDTISDSIRKTLVWIGERSFDKSSLLGKISDDLRSFCANVDLDHPYLNELFQEVKVNESKFALLKEAICASEYFKESGFDLLASVIRNQFNRSNDKYREIPKDFARNISRPPVRLLKDAVLRKEARLIKQPQVQYLSTTLAYAYCDDQPRNFTTFFCGYNYEDEIADQEFRRQTFSELHLSSFANKISHKITAIKEREVKQYYGFIRLKPQDAAMILARSIDLRWSAGTKYIQVPRGIIPSNCVFWKEALTNSLKYQAHKYPLHTFKVEVPKRTDKILELVENYPAVGNKPIFDHFWVVCPSFHLDAKEFCNDKSRWELRLGGKNTVVEWTPTKTKDCEDGVNEVNGASLVLDMFLAKQGFSTPVVLGERNGECFFLCYWC